MFRERKRLVTSGLDNSLNESSLPTDYLTLMGFQGHALFSDGWSDIPLTLVIPVFNEELRLHENRDELLTFIGRQPAGSRLVIVDDGSLDGTARIAHNLAATDDRVVVVERPHLGKGAAVEFGMTLAETPVVGYTDVDLSTPLVEVERLFALSSQTRALVIGSRGMPNTSIGIHQSRARELLGRLFNLWAQALLAPGIRDTQCGAKFAPAGVWHELFEFTAERGFAWDAEIVALAVSSGIPVIEEGIVWNHDPSTRVRVLRDGLLMAFSVLRVAVRVRRRRPATLPTADELQRADS